MFFGKTITTEFSARRIRYGKTLVFRVRRRCHGAGGGRSVRRGRKTCVAAAGDGFSTPGTVCPSTAVEPLVSVTSHGRTDQLRAEADPKDCELRTGRRIPEATGIVLHAVFLLFLRSKIIVVFCFFINFILRSKNLERRTIGFVLVDFCRSDIYFFFSPGEPSTATTKIALCYLASCRHCLHV